MIKSFQLIVLPAGAQLGSRVPHADAPLTNSARYGLQARDAPGGPVAGRAPRNHLGPGGHTSHRAASRPNDTINFARGRRQPGAANQRHGS